MEETEAKEETRKSRKQNHVESSRVHARVSRQIRTCPHPLALAAITTGKEGHRRLKDII